MTTTKKALITGALGQDGTYLTEYLLSLGYRVYGLIRRAPFSNKVSSLLLRDLVKAPHLTYLYGDVRDELSLRTAIQKSWPDEIYNFAGQVFVPVSWQEPAITFDINTGGLARILKIVSEIKKDTKVYQASTSEMFGNHEGACSDETEFRPTSPYGIAKLAAHNLVQLYRSNGLFVVGGILFNHESPRRGHEMVTMKIASQVARWSQGDESTLMLGNLDSRRDWGFAGEYVTAMHTMMQQEEADDFVVGTGRSHSVKDFLTEACEVAGLRGGFWMDKVKWDERLSRVKEIYDMRADNRKIWERCNWVPQVVFRDLVRMMVEAEMEKLRQEVTNEARGYN